MHHEDMKAILERQKAAFAREGFVDAKTRTDRLQRVYRLIGDHQQDIVEACHSDFGGRSRHQSRLSEVLAVMTGFEHSIRHVRQWMKPEKRAVAFPLNLIGARARVEYVPKGVIGCMGTWNFPVYTAILPVAGILAAGNRAMLKLSELTPETSALLQGLVSRYFDATELVAITGGPDTGAAFASLPLDHLIFTGGTHIGRQVMRAAAENLTPVTLELGGKSPVIVGRSCDPAKAAERIMAGKALNQGQACLAPDYCFVPEETMESFLARASRFYGELFPCVLDNPDYSSVINERHYQRLARMIQDARDKGGDVRVFNPAGEDFTSQAPGQHKMPMTWVANPSDDMLVMQEEIFGPILCIKPYRHITECIEYINAAARPLGLYYFGSDRHEERLVLDSTISGGVTINDVMSHSSCDNLPFGGIGNSGMGHYHGFDGFRTFSHARAIYHQSRLDIMKLSGMLPPYGKKCEQQLERLCKPRE